MAAPLLRGWPAQLPERAGGVARSAWASWRAARARPRAPKLPSAAELEDLPSAALPALPAPAHPEVSVVIPVYGQKAATLNCLASLATTPAGRSFETIVVDDRSPDDTPALLQRIAGIHLHVNPANLGFIGASNAGAALARGRILCFLNNDTAVLPGWLDALVSTFETHPRAGLVGPRLLFADGRIQEAGGTIFRDATGSHFGRNRSPGPSAYEHVRPVDYVSGACAVIPRALFERLGGFDAHFAPAYYEDTDLAFRVRGEGLEVLHQPAARVFHYEGMTHGRDETKGVKRHQVINRERFLARWQDILHREHPVPGRRSLDAADRRRGRRLLFVTDAPDHPLRSLARRLALEARPAWWSPGLDAAGLRELGDLGIEPLGPIEAPNLELALRRVPTHHDALVLGLSRPSSAGWLQRARRAAPDARIFVDLPAGHPAEARLVLADARLVPPRSEVDRPEPAGEASGPVLWAPLDDDALRRWLETELEDALRRR